MSLAADKKLWDKLHEDLKKKSETLLAYEIELGTKYGHNFQTQWLSTAQKKKLEKLRDAKEKTGEKIYELVSRISPRQWDRDVPSWWVRSELTWEDAIRPKNESLSVIVPGSYGVPDGTVKETSVEQDPETAGIEYATAQLESDYFMDWVREQLAEAADMDPSEVLPLETKADARVIAKNMLQQLEWDTKRDLNESKEFFAGFHRGLTNPSTVDWLADELLEIKGQMRGDVRVGRSNVNEAQRSTSSEQYVLYYSQPSGRQATLWYARRRPGDGGKDWEYTKDPKLAGVFGMRDLQRWVALHGKKAGWRVVGKTAEAPRRVRDYIAIDSHDRPVGPRHKGYSDAKRDADNAGGIVKFVPGNKRLPTQESRRPKAARSARRRR